MSGTVAYYFDTSYEAIHYGLPRLNENEALAERTISVIVPSCGRMDDLSQLLGVLGECSGLFELVIAFDGMHLDESQPRIWTPEQLTTKLLFIGKRVGASRARNIAAAEATGDILLFLDDDVLPSGEVLEYHRRAYDDPDVVAAAGPVVLYSDSTSLLENNPLLFSFAAPSSVSTPYWGVSANFSVLRRAFSQVQFDESYPKNGGGEDVFLGLNLLKHGRVLAVPEAEVKHSYWTGTINVLRRFFRWGYADGHTTLKCMRLAKHDTHFRRLLIPHEGFCLGTAILFSCLVYLVSSDHPASVLAAFFPVVFFLLQTYIGCRRKQSRLQSLFSVLSISVFQTGSYLRRILSGDLRSFLWKVKYFETEERALWMANYPYFVGLVVVFIVSSIVSLSF